MKSITNSIRIGVTGHRSLDNELLLKEKITIALKKDILTLIDFKSNNYIRKNQKIPITYSVLTMLAEGADRLVAKTVLEYDKFAEIEVVLPLTLSDYKETFSNPEDQQFDKLYNCASHVIHIYKNDRNNDSELNDLLKAQKINEFISQKKKEYYEKAGRYMVDHCDVLIGVWNGRKSRGKGGTKEIIDYARKKKRPVILISSNPPFEIVIDKGNGLN